MKAGLFFLSVLILWPQGLFSASTTNLNYFGGFERFQTMVRYSDAQSKKQ